jgi:hypothetical protein
MSCDLAELSRSKARAKETREVLFPSALEERLGGHRLDGLDAPH